MPGRALVVGAAVEIKAVVDEHALVLQEVDIGVSQKDIHARVAGLGFVLVEGEPGEDLLLDVVVAIAGVDAVGALDGAERGGELCGVIQGVVLVVEDVPGDDHQVGV